MLVVVCVLVVVCMCDDDRWSVSLVKGASYTLCRNYVHYLKHRYWTHVEV